MMRLNLFGLAAAIINYHLGVNKLFEKRIISYVSNLHVARARVVKN